MSEQNFEHYYEKDYVTVRRDSDTDAPLRVDVDADESDAVESSEERECPPRRPV